jgi:hypothetical protein
MCGLWVEELEIPEIVVCSLRLRDFIMRLRLASMDNIWELHCILDEEDGYVIADNIPVAFLSVELDCESSNITNSISTTPTAEDGRES